MAGVIYRPPLRLRIDDEGQHAGAFFLTACDVRYVVVYGGNDANTRHGVRPNRLHCRCGRAFTPIGSCVRLRLVLAEKQRSISVFIQPYGVNHFDRSPANQPSLRCPWLQTQSVIDN